ncbi:MAG: hypothetical protein KatS3mg068_0141 [Candidatus Sericytochromatia bacterium]|nr:MAG: hypothetical protein KatS3mg068_0141 [Candidatus Sericytochromatia bacterium]
MGGNIYVESMVGKGSEFIFTINTEYHHKLPTMFISNKEEKLKGKKVLILDDNLTNLKVLSSQMKNWGVENITFNSPSDALNYLNNNKVEIIITDMQMPEMDGLDFSSNVKNLNKNIYIILLTSLSNFNYNMYIQEGLINDYLYKPVKQSTLFNIIYKILLKTENVIKNQRQVFTKIESNIGKNYLLNILVAEDNLVNQKLANKIFEKLGYKIDIANNGLEVIEKLKNNKYDIIFMDIQMPEMDGLEATKYIIDTYNTQRPKIIAMTANAMQEDINKCFEVGMDDYISKPISIEKLQNILKKYATLKM